MFSMLKELNIDWGWYTEQVKNQFLQARYSRTAPPPGSDGWELCWDDLLSVSGGRSTRMADELFTLGSGYMPRDLLVSVTEDGRGTADQLCEWLSDEMFDRVLRRPDTGPGLPFLVENCPSVFRRVSRSQRTLFTGSRSSRVRLGVAGSDEFERRDRLNSLLGSQDRYPYVVLPAEVPDPLEAMESMVPSPMKPSPLQDAFVYADKSRLLLTEAVAGLAPFSDEELIMLAQSNIGPLLPELLVLYAGSAANPPRVVACMVAGYLNHLSAHSAPNYLLSFWRDVSAGLFRSELIAPVYDLCEKLRKHDLELEAAPRVWRQDVERLTRSSWGEMVGQPSLLSANALWGDKEPVDKPDTDGPEDEGFWEGLSAEVFGHKPYSKGLVGRLRSARTRYPERCSALVEVSLRTIEGKSVRFLPVSPQFLAPNPVTVMLQLGAGFDRVARAFPASSVIAAAPRASAVWLLERGGGMAVTGFPQIVDRGSKDTLAETLALFPR